MAFDGSLCFNLREVDVSRVGNKSSNYLLDG